MCIYIYIYVYTHICIVVCTCVRARLAHVLISMFSFTPRVALMISRETSAWRGLQQQGITTCRHIDDLGQDV